MAKNIAIIGANGAIGTAMIEHYVNEGENVYAFSRTEYHQHLGKVSSHIIDYDCENSLANAADIASWDIVVIALGILTDTTASKPEKSFKQLRPEILQHLFLINSVYPAMCAKFFLPQLKNRARSVFAILSARVGSINDNRSGGWHAYRASKAALNMLIKNFSIEMKRLNKQAIVIGLHPGTVDSNLSKHFQSNVPEGKLFTAEQSAAYLSRVISQVTIEQSGACIAWDGHEIPA